MNRKRLAGAIAIAIAVAVGALVASRTEDRQPTGYHPGEDRAATEDSAGPARSGSGPPGEVPKTRQVQNLSSARLSWHRTDWLV